jgi:hypothetical protein
MVFVGGRRIDGLVISIAVRLGIGTEYARAFACGNSDQVSRKEDDTKAEDEIGGIESRVVRALNYVDNQSNRC